MNQRILDFEKIASPALRSAGLAIFALAWPICAMGQASGQTFVKPGATGSIQIPIQNDATSVDDAADVQISVIAPAFFTVANTSTVGPLSITAGQTNTFVVN